MGLYAHREGYNVLYGYGSAKWYGDPQQRIMLWGPENYFDTAYTNDVVETYTAMVSLDNAGMVNSPTRDAANTWYPYRLRWSLNVTCSTNVWHGFDVTAGFDVDAPQQ